MTWSATRFVIALSTVSGVLATAACGSAGLGVSSQGLTNTDATVDGGGVDGGHKGRDAIADRTVSVDVPTLTQPDTGAADSEAGRTSHGVCVPKTCFELGYNCGPAGDGCGNLIQCGNCTPPQTCGGGGDAGKLSNCGGTDNCKKQTCASQGFNCGPAGDGCGNLIQCGSCPPPATCGGGGTPSQCGGDAGCIPTTCAKKGVSCGPTGDGCGGI